MIGAFRTGDIPYRRASIIKAKTILSYNPKHNALQGFARARKWYWESREGDTEARKE